MTGKATYDELSQRVNELEKEPFVSEFMSQNLVSITLHGM